MNLILKNGAQGRIRTTDTRIFSAMLYQLSYLGAPRNQRRQLIGNNAAAVQQAPPAVSCRLKQSHNEITAMPLEHI